MSVRPRACPAELAALKKHLFTEYGGFADKRVKKLEKGNLFIIDDRDPRRDVGADKKLYPWFCLMFAEVLSGREVVVRMWGNVPSSSSVQKWVDSGHAGRTDAPAGLQISVPLGQEDKLRTLAGLIDDIVKPGARYSEKSYKYVCPRTASSLRRLADTLQRARMA